MTYLEIAEDNYNFLINAFNFGIISQSLGDLSQLVCESYLKHFIIKKFNFPEEEEKDLLNIHSLKKLVRMIEKKRIKVSKKMKFSLFSIDGFSEICPYPGPDNIELTKKDIPILREAIALTKEFVEKYEQNTR